MKTDQNARLAKHQSLARAQNKQAKQLKKAERARYRLEKASQKLRRLEAAIAAIVRPPVRRTRRRLGSLRRSRPSSGALG
jgi:hypothetical protein